MSFIITKIFNTEKEREKHKHKYVLKFVCQLGSPLKRRRKNKLGQKRSKQNDHMDNCKNETHFSIHLKRLVGQLMYVYIKK